MARGGKILNSPKFSIVPHNDCKIARLLLQPLYDWTKNKLWTDNDLITICQLAPFQTNIFHLTLKTNHNKQNLFYSPITVAKKHNTNRPRYDPDLPGCPIEPIWTWLCFRLTSALLIYVLEDMKRQLEESENVPYNCWIWSVDDLHKSQRMPYK